ncbi:MAG: hypothetical protein KBB71_04915 [Lentimicrobiaceae bacterium]|nr:hypothetical protein [Lentimicrobiaceae bacterium]
MEITNSKTVFIEYSSARKGQHFMTVVQTINHDRVIIGRIFREYDPNTKQSKYFATDFTGTQVFYNVSDLAELKSRFKNSGKSMAEMAQAFKKTNRQKYEKYPYVPNVSRTNEIKAIREKKSDKEKVKDKTEKPDRLNPSEKNVLNQMERQQDEKNSVQLKAEENIKENEISNENEEEKSQQPEIELSDREIELAEIRNDHDDRELDMDIER